MNLRDLIKLDEKYKKNILTFLSDDERTRSFRSMGLKQTLKNITAYMIYATNKSYDEIEKCLLTKQWIKDEGWRLPTIDELKALATNNPKYFNIFYNYISGTTDELNGNFIKYIETTYTDKIRVDKCNKAYYKSMVAVLVTEKEF